MLNTYMQHMWVCSPMQVFEETRDRWSSILFLDIIFETTLLIKPRTCHFSWTNRPRSCLLRFTRLCPFLDFVCTATTNFHVCNGHLIPGPHAFMANSLLTKPPPSHVFVISSFSVLVFLLLTEAV